MKATQIVYHCSSASATSDRVLRFPNGSELTSEHIWNVYASLNIVSFRVLLLFRVTALRDDTRQQRRRPVDMRSPWSTFLYFISSLDFSAGLQSAVCILPLVCVLHWPVASQRYQDTCRKIYERLQHAMATLWTSNVTWSWLHTSASISGPSLTFPPFAFTIKSYFLESLVNRIAGSCVQNFSYNLKSS